MTKAERPARLRVGIDVGGTNTDAVLLDGGIVLTWTKTPTTADVTSGVEAALKTVLRQAGANPASVSAVMVGTTQFTNAVIQRRGLARTAALRLCLPAGESLPPFTDWPEDLREAIGGTYRLLHGGFEFDGRVISPLDELEIDRALGALLAHGVQSVAVTGIFSPLDAEQEARVAQLAATRMPGCVVTVSNEIGRIGMLERENAALLNACLAQVAARVIGGLSATLDRAGLSCPLYVSQNDGTLMTAEYATRFPVFTFASGPTNSMRGAAALSGIRDGVVIDVGGTSADLGALTGGFPRQASFEVAVGGVRTNFRMPDVVSLALGGGSIVSADGQSVGPVSVGFELATRALVFGGDTLTATDVAVATGRTLIGDAARVARLDAGIAASAMHVVASRLESALDGVRTSPEPVMVIAVGGGSFLVPDQLPGASAVVRPEHYEVANAVGAALSQVSGEIDRVYLMDGRTRADVLAAARAEAEARAVAAGADPATLELIDVDEVPLAYLPSTAVRVHVKLVGDLRA